MKSGYYKLTKDVTPRQHPRKRERDSFPAGTHFLVETFPGEVPEIEGLSEEARREIEESVARISVYRVRLATGLLGSAMEEDYAKEVVPHLEPAEMTTALAIFDAIQVCGLDNVLRRLVLDGTVGKADIARAAAAWDEGMQKDESYGARIAGEIARMP